MVTGPKHTYMTNSILVSVSLLSGSGAGFQCGEKADESRGRQHTIAVK